MKNILIIFISAVFIAACSSNGSPDKKAELDQLKKEATSIQEKIASLEKEIAKENKGETNLVAKNIIAEAVTAQTFRHYIEVQAKVDGEESVSVSPEMPGTVTRVLVKAGDRVSKGSVLAELDNSVTAKAIEEVQTVRDFANTLYIKQKSLWDQKIGTEVQYLSAKNNLESMDRKLATLREQLSMSRIKSPINGTVDRVIVKIGQTASPGFPAVNVVNLSNLTVKAEVAEAYISKVKRGDEVIVHFPDLGKEITAKLSYSGQVIDPTNRTFNVEVDINSKEVSANPNMVAILKIADYKIDNAISVPVKLVQTTPEGSHLYIAEGSKDKAVARKKVVVTGKNYNGQIEIKEGLKAGDQVITSGYQDLMEGQPLKF